ncbi:hypothetical protein pb186bvf_020557 [Paramecium bursaria]
MKFSIRQVLYKEQLSIKGKTQDQFHLQTINQIFNKTNENVFADQVIPSHHRILAEQKDLELFQYTQLQIYEQQEVLKWLFVRGIQLLEETSSCLKRHLAARSSIQLLEQASSCKKRHHFMVNYDLFINTY